jgi:hypothetical protein
MAGQIAKLTNRLELLLANGEPSFMLFANDEWLAVPSLNLPFCQLG